MWSGRKQKPVTPEILTCHCGQKANLIDWDFNDQWFVVCEANHVMSRACGSRHRAVMLWNNRIEEKLAENQ